MINRVSQSGVLWKEARLRTGPLEHDTQETVIILNFIYILINIHVPRGYFLIQTVAVDNLLCSTSDYWIFEVILATRYPPVSLYSLYKVNG